MIYPVDRAIQPLNNWALDPPLDSMCYTLFYPFCDQCCLNRLLISGLKSSEKIAQNKTGEKKLPLLLLFFVFLITLALPFALLQREKKVKYKNICIMNTFWLVQYISIIIFSFKTTGIVFPNNIENELSNA